MDLKLQRIAAWGGIVMFALFFVFFMLIAKLIPPISPTSSAREVTDFLIANKLRVRVGLALTAVSACVIVPFQAALVLRVRHVEGKWGLLSLAQLFAAVLFVVPFLFATMVLAAAAFRPETRDPAITLALDDVFWLTLVAPVGPVLTQALVLTVASFAYPTATFPRWFGYLNAWLVLLSLPGQAVVIFNEGPLAWNGIFAFWIPTVAFSIWLIVATKLILGSISAEQAADRPLATTAA